MAESATSIGAPTVAKPIVVSGAPVVGEIEATPNVLLKVLGMYRAAPFGDSTAALGRNPPEDPDLSPERHHGHAGGEPGHYADRQYRSAAPHRCEWTISVRAGVQRWHLRFPDQRRVGALTALPGSPFSAGNSNVAIAIVQPSP